jgi:hypothetical protein
MSALRQWRIDGNHLPHFMRDFHDAKDLFKTIHDQYKLYDANDGRSSPSWIDAQIYVMDSFLWFMAAHGYTLQRCRAKQEFVDIYGTLAYWRNKRDDAGSAMLKSALDGRASQETSATKGSAP